MNTLTEFKCVELRIKLLQDHLQEQQRCVTDETEARRSLQNKHQQETNSFEYLGKKNRLFLIGLGTKQVEELNNLARLNSLKRQAILARQKEEDDQLDRLISLF